MPEPTTQSALSASGLSKSFGKGPARVQVLRGLDLRVRPGEFVAVMGPSGCGKTTLLHVLGLMTAPDAGQIELAGKPAPLTAGGRTLARRRQIGFVFQRFNLLNVLSGRDNVRLSLRVRGLHDDERIEQLLDRLGVAEVAGRKPGEMSIGEQQRVAVVRGLAHRPQILLADEPTGNLDSAAGDALLDVFREMNQTEGQTIVMITHSAHAADRADRILHMRDGRIVDGGNVEGRGARVE